MRGLLVADKDAVSRKRMANLLMDAGYDVAVTNSAAETIHDVLNNTAQVVLLGKELDELTSAELVPLLKQCNRNLVIILVADDAPLPLIRKVRKEGIFYHALRPAKAKDEEEIRQAVKYALERLKKTEARQITHYQ